MDKKEVALLLTSDDNTQGACVSVNSHSTIEKGSVLVFFKIKKLGLSLFLLPYFGTCLF